jgi:hypothetical protein
VPANLRSLELTHVREKYLGELLSVTLDLRALKWHWYYDYGVKDQITTPIVHLDQLVTAISFVQGTLTELTITANCDIGGGDVLLPGVKIEGPLGGMVSFEALKQLQIPWAFLMGFAEDMARQFQYGLPKNFEHLTITDDLQP